MADMANRILISSLGYELDEAGFWEKKAFDGRVIASIPDDGLGNYPPEFLKGLLKQKEEEGRFQILDLEG